MALGLLFSSASVLERTTNTVSESYSIEKQIWTEFYPEINVNSYNSETYLKLKSKDITSLLKWKLFSACLFLITQLNWLVALCFRHPVKLQEKQPSLLFEVCYEVMKFQSCFQASLNRLNGLQMHRGWSSAPNGEQLSSETAEEEKHSEPLSSQAVVVFS